MPVEAGLRAVTWNVHSCIGTDRRFDPERVGAVLNGLGADIAGLQEVGWFRRGRRGFDQFAHLAASTGLHAVPGPTRDDGRSHYGNALLTRLPVREVRPLDLSVPMREPRAAIDADLDAGGTLLRVVVVHLGLDPWERAEQVARLLDRLGPDDGTPVLLMGDLNEWRVRSPRIRRLKERLPVEASAPSFPSRLPALRLDRAFACAPVRLHDVSAVRDASARTASDHLPLRMQVIVPRSARRA
jgi:endonuclease/exonuclease/phosphatase family metal-dependent hydrolase